MAGEIIVLITASSEDEAAKIGSALVDEHLAACVNIVPEVRSLFFWEGKTQDGRELLLICKSRQPLLGRIIARVKSLHSYTVSEVIALPVVGGSEDYLRWLREATGE
ncbi:MAG TPA: divalent-cation tolerance protein CutA [Nitrospirota bacterium]